MKYRIRDRQFQCRYFDDGVEFDSKDEILYQLSDYHNIDYTGIKDNDEPYKNIHEFLATLKNNKERLNWLLDYGEWEIEEVGIECARCGVNTTKWSGTPEFKVCENCFQDLQNDGSID